MEITINNPPNASDFTKDEVALLKKTVIEPS